jgi:hypothetical protein
MYPVPEMVWGRDPPPAPLGAALAFRNDGISLAAGATPCKPKFKAGQGTPRFGSCHA